MTIRQAIADSSCASSTITWPYAQYGSAQARSAVVSCWPGSRFQSASVLASTRSASLVEPPKASFPTGVISRTSRAYRSSARRSRSRARRRRLSAVSSVPSNWDASSSRGTSATVHESGWPGRSSAARSAAERPGAAARRAPSSASRPATSRCGVRNGHSASSAARTGGSSHSRARAYGTSSGSRSRPSARASAAASAPSRSVMNSLRAALCGLRSLRARSRARSTTSLGTVMTTPSAVISRSPGGTCCRLRTAWRSTFTIVTSPLTTAASGLSSGAALTPGEELGDRAEHHVGLAEGRQDLADVAEEGGVRPDDEHAAALERAPVGVEQVRGPVQRRDGLAGARAALHDQHALQRGADDPVLLGLDGGHHVAHPAGAAAGDARDQHGLAGQAPAVRLGQPVQVEDLVVDPGDRAVPGVDVTAADQAVRVAGGGGVEGVGRGGAPVDEPRLVLVVAQADPADVQRARAVRRGLRIGAAEAQAVLHRV